MSGDFFFSVFGSVVWALPSAVKCLSDYWLISIHTIHNPMRMYRNKITQVSLTVTCGFVLKEAIVV